jgi:hypothetical protein
MLVIGVAELTLAIGGKRLVDFPAQARARSSLLPHADALVKRRGVPATSRAPGSTT